MDVLKHTCTRSGRGNRSGVYRYCQEEDDTAGHTFFKCRKWKDERENSQRAFGNVINYENLSNKMLESEDGRDQKARKQHYVGQRKGWKREGRGRKKKQDINQNPQKRPKMQAKEKKIESAPSLRSNNVRTSHRERTEEDWRNWRYRGNNKEVESGQAKKYSRKAVLWAGYLPALLVRFSGYSLASGRVSQYPTAISPMICATKFSQQKNKSWLSRTV